MQERTKRSAVEWREWVERWADSGQSQLAFAQQHGLVLATFRYWLAKQRRSGDGTAPGSGRFVSVVSPAQVESEASPVRRPVLVRWGSLEVEMTQLPPMTWLRQLVEELC